MVEARVVYTNVLIVASAADDVSPFRHDATPVQEAALRQEVLTWLIQFEDDPERYAVMDWGWLICGEYCRKLTEQDYGWLALMTKKDRNEVLWVGLAVDQDGHAVLPENLAVAVTDLADRKMVGAVLEARAQILACKLVNACDTDWIDCEEALSSHMVEIQHLIEDWLRSKWAAMQVTA